MLAVPIGWVWGDATGVRQAATAGVVDVGAHACCVLLLAQPSVGFAGLCADYSPQFVP